MIAVLVSGGKDSTACLLLALKKYDKDKVLPIFADTGFESRYTYAYLDYLENKLRIKIYRVSYGMDLPSLIRKKKKFPSARMRFCTYYLKQLPVAEFLAENPVEEVWIGIRSAESQKRQTLYGELTPEDTFSYADMSKSLPSKLRKQIEHVKARLPIVNWSQEQVLKFLQENGIELNPLYLKGHKRVGCFPCILGTLADYKLCYKDEEGKKNIQLLAKIEKELSDRGYLTRLKDNITAKELLRRLELNDRNFELFKEGEQSCFLCTI